MNKTDIKVINIIKADDEELAILKHVRDLQEGVKDENIVASELYEASKAYVQGIVWNTIRNMGGYCNKEEAEMYGNMAFEALLRAARRYDVNRGAAKFKTYAYSAVERAVRDAWIDDHEAVAPWRKNPTISIVSFDAPLNHGASDSEGDGFTLGDCLEDEHGDVEKSIIKREEWIAFNKALRKLAPTTQKIVRLMIGYDERDKMSRSAVAKEMGLPEAVVTVLFENGKKQLREMMTNAS